MFPISLIGGGWESDGFRHTYSPFVKEAMLFEGCKIALILAAESEPDKPEMAAKYCSVFEALGVGSQDLRVIWVSAAAPLRHEVLASYHPTGVFVGGGRTPLYHSALCNDRAWLDYLREARIPYAGFSAGAAIAARHAILGGWKVQRNDREISILDADLSEDLDLLEVRQGLGLIPFSVDVHASQWGTLGRLMQTIDLELNHDGWAIDENTLVHVQGNQIQVQGLGHAYRVQRQAASILNVRLYRAGDHLHFNPRV
jgi:cyanophycinase